MKYQISKDMNKECICVKTTIEPIIICRIFLTSPVVREEAMDVQQERMLLLFIYFVLCAH
jgi:hypothetical protein